MRTRRQLTIGMAFWLAYVQEVDVPEHSVMIVMIEDIIPYKYMYLLTVFVGS
jgi:hypothetical protein